MSTISYQHHLYHLVIQHSHGNHHLISFINCLPPIFYLKLAEKTSGSPVLWLCLNLAHPKWHFFWGKRWSSVGIRRICTGHPTLFFWTKNLPAECWSRRYLPRLVSEPKNISNSGAVFQLWRSQKMIQERFPPIWYFDLDVVIDFPLLKDHFTWGSWGPPTLEHLHTETAVLSILFGSSSSL